MCVLIFSTIFVWNNSYYKKNWARHDKKCILVFMWSTRYSCQILKKFEFYWQTFEKHRNIKFQKEKIRSVGTKSFNAEKRTDRRTGRHDEVYSRFLQSCQRA